MPIAATSNPLLSPSTLWITKSFIFFIFHPNGYFIFCHLSIAHWIFFAIFLTDMQYLSLRISACSIYVTNKYPCILLKAFPPTVNPAGCFRIGPSAHRRAVITRKVSCTGTELHALHCSEKFCCSKIKSSLLYSLICLSEKTTQWLVC